MISPLKLDDLLCLISACVWLSLLLVLLQRQASSYNQSTNATSKCNDSRAP